MSAVTSAAVLNVGTIEERTLIQRAATDNSAVAELYRRHVRQVSSYVQRRLGGTADADDIVSTVFLAMVRHIGRLRRDDKPLIACLYRVATNEINSTLRRRRVMCSIGLASEPAVPADVDIHNADHVRLLLLRLPIKYQSVLSLHYLEQLSVEETSQALGFPTGTIKTRLARGRDLLRIELEAAERRSERRHTSL